MKRKYTRSCHARREYRKNWRTRYRELETAFAIAEKNQNNVRMDHLGDRLADMEMNNEFPQCFNCKKRNCIVHQFYF